MPVLLKDYVCGDHGLYYRILVEEAAVIAYKETSMAFFVKKLKIPIRSSLSRCGITQKPGHLNTPAASGKSLISMIWSHSDSAR